MTSSTDGRYFSDNVAAYASPIALLESAGRKIDRLWQTALSSGHGSEAFALGEASLAIHRALIALQNSAHSHV